MGPTTPHEEDYPACPEERDLIGFITSGGFDLGEGGGRGVGCVVLGKVLGREGDTDGKERVGDGGEGGGKGAGEGQAKAISGMMKGGKGAGSKGLKSEDKICIVRNAGQSVARLARWEFISS